MLVRILTLRVCMLPLVLRSSNNLLTLRCSSTFSIIGSFLTMGTLEASFALTLETWVLTV